MIPRISSPSLSFGANETRSSVRQAYNNCLENARTTAQIASRQTATPNVTVPLVPAMPSAQSRASVSMQGTIGTNLNYLA